MDLFKILKDEEIKKCKIKSFKKGNIIVREGEVCNSVFYIIKGEIIISSSNIDGKEDIYNHLINGDMFANILVFAEKNVFLGDVISLKDSEILIIDKEDLFVFLQNNKVFLNWFLSYNSNETMKSKLQTKLLSKRSIKERVLYYLSINQGSINISITQLSMLIMINRVCVSRVVSNLIEEGLIKKEGKKLILLY